MRNGPGMLVKEEKKRVWEVYLSAERHILWERQL
jgi:hypothetical protein